MHVLAPSLPYRARTVLAAAGAAALLGACSNIADTARSAVETITPYKTEVVQGNFVSREQVAVLQPGMSRQQVRDILGTPLMASVFHTDRWEYVFTIQRQGTQRQEHRLTVFFSGDTLLRTEGDEMPTETEFVASLGKPAGKLNIPPLQATEEQLARHPASSVATTEAGTSAPPRAAGNPAAASSRSYPPLETARP